MLRKYIYFLLIVIFFAALIPDIHSQSDPLSIRAFPEKTDSIFSDTLKKVVDKNARVDSIIDYGKKFLGLRYRYGGTTEQGFDCSGYVSYIFKKFGYSLPTSSSAMATVGEKIDILSARKGDFIYFKGRSTKSSRVGHVALIIQADSGQITMMHSCQRGVLIEKYNDSQYYKTRYIMCRRVEL